MNYTPRVSDILPGMDNIDQNLLDPSREALYKSLKLREDSLTRLAMLASYVDSIELILDEKFGPELKGSLSQLPIKTGINVQDAFNNIWTSVRLLGNTIHGELRRGLNQAQADYHTLTEAIAEMDKVLEATEDKTN